MALFAIEAPKTIATALDNSVKTIDANFSPSYTFSNLECDSFFHQRKRRKRKKKYPQEELNTKSEPLV